MIMNSWEATRIIVTLADIMHKLSRAGSKAIYCTHIGEHFSHFSSSNDVISAMSIFDPRKVPKADSWAPDLSKYGEKQLAMVHS